MAAIVDEKEPERGGFEPPVRLPAHTLSKRAPSATRSSLLRRHACLGPRQSVLHACYTMARSRRHVKPAMFTPKARLYPLTAAVLPSGEGHLSQRTVRDAPSSRSEDRVPGRCRGLAPVGEPGEPPRVHAGAAPTHAGAMPSTAPQQVALEDGWIAMRRVDPLGPAPGWRLAVSLIESQFGAGCNPTVLAERSSATTKCRGNDVGAVIADGRGQARAPIAYTITVSKHHKPPPARVCRDAQCPTNCPGWR